MIIKGVFITKVVFSVSAVCAVVTHKHFHNWNSVTEENKLQISAFSIGRRPMSTKGRIYKADTGCSFCWVDYSLILQQSITGKEVSEPHRGQEYNKMCHLYLKQQLSSAQLVPILQSWLKIAKSPAIIHYYNIALALALAWIKGA